MPVQRAHILGWSFVALVNGLCITALLPWPGASLRLAQHAYDIGNLLLLGLLSELLVIGWRRLAPSSERWAYPALALLAVALSVPVLERDLVGLARKLGGDDGSDGFLLLLLLGFASLVPAAAWVGARCSRRPLRWAALAVAAMAVLANHLALRGGYPGLHLWTVWLSALLVSGAVHGAPVPSRLRLGVWPGRAGWLLAAAAALSSVLLWPSNAVLIELYRTPGTVMTPFLARFHVDSMRGSAVVPEGSWYVDRSQMPGIPASTPPLLHDDALVIVITIDAMRADMLDSRWADEMPTIQRLRRESVEFSMARSTGSQTVYTLATLFSGKHFSQLYWTRKSDKRSGDLWPWQDRTRRLGTLLQDQGVTTVSFASAWWLWSSMGVIGLFDEEQKIRSEKKTAYGFPLARDVMAPAIERVKSHHVGQLFMFMHFMDPHAPYDLGGKATTAKGRYAKEIGLVDTQLRKLIAMLKRSEQWSRTVLIISSDHGEGFGQHDTDEHATTLYEELLRVPLLIRVPGMEARVVDEPVSTIDIGPTVLDLFGAATPAYFMGQSLLPFVRGQSPRLTRPIIAEGRLKQALVTREGIKAIRDLRRGTEEAYDLNLDPEETRNLADSEKGRAVLDALASFFEVHTYRRPGYEVPFRK